ncbi:MAG TPA: dihydrolipoamide acetyltransferase family protein [Polyangiaceae bacterium]|nr:dihydrolipoamide acetyltransferase family protein [Polyangiaceae bacterium]
MSKFEFKLPDIGEGVTEGEIVGWLIKQGESVAEDQEMVEVMTDKATVTIGAPKAGKVLELRGAVGDVIPVGDVLVVLDLSGGGAAEAEAPSAKAEAPAAKAEAPAAKAEAKPAAKAPAESAASAVGDIKEELPGTKLVAQAPAASANDYYNDKPLAAPATRKLARELGVDLRQVKPSGDAGRVTREDVEQQARAGSAPAAPAAKAPAAAEAKAPAPLPSPQVLASDERKPIRGLRRRIFDNMARSKHTAAHFTYADECEVSKLMELRARTKPYAEQAGVKLTFLPFIVKATVIALKKHRELNCIVDDAAQEMVLKGSFDIGMATATDAGLIVPVIRQADRKSVLEIAREIDRLATDARNGKTRQEDVGGGSFTITSLGRLGGMFSTPVVNYPEVAILGVHEIKKKPIIKDDAIVIGNVMILALSFDHRIIDGHVGAAFAQEIIGLLEEPDRLLVEM